MRRGLERAFAAAAGLLHAQSFSHPALHALQPAALALLAWRVALAPHAASAAWLGGLFGFGWLAGGVWWLFVSMHRYGGMPAWLAALAVAALCAALSLYLAAAMAAHVALVKRSRLWPPLVFAAAWLLAELARATIFTGFPWLASGYAHADGPLGRLAPWIGVYGIGFVSALLAATLGHLWARRGWRSAAIAAALLVLLGSLAGLLPNTRFTEPSQTLSISLLQGNVPQDEKFSAEHLPQTLDWYVNALLDAEGEFVITPETAVPLLPQQLPEGWWQDLERQLARHGKSALVGVPLGSFEEGYTNSALGLVDGRTVYRYDKHHLVPFGEFIPPGFRWFVDLMRMPLGDFSRGPLNAPSLEVRGERIAPNICYEDLFGEELAARFADPARAPTIFANISNIAWFGETVAVPQHLQISRLRALEFERPMVRATNTGATVVINHHGQVTHALEPHTRGTLTAPVQGRTGLTPYARWMSAWGLWPLVAGALAVLGLAGLWRRRADTERPAS
ncbi:apolipoprotein N-acyltransferase [Caldimonas tepidiphila]|uniref:apolipoprotein N-acyltransferase n=1 Tax=Caldimonas tepidiphila TaxID=2315841 RepID=UPI000E5BC485|nr:apolipoprotein N-acyltransferase [Caldimonas tepidiphila]